MKETRLLVMPYFLRDLRKGVGKRIKTSTHIYVSKSLPSPPSAFVYPFPYELCSICARMHVHAAYARAHAVRNSV